MATSWTFSRKLATSMAVIVVLVLVLAAIAVSALRQMSEDEHEVLAQRASNLIDAQRLDALTSDKVAGSRGYLLTGDERFVREVERVRSEIAALLEPLRASERSAEVAAQLAQLAAAHDAHHDATVRVIELRRGGASAAEVSAFFDERVAPLYDALVQQVEAYRLHERAALDDARASNLERAELARDLVLGVAAGVVALAILIAVVLARALSRQIGSSVEHVRVASVELQAAATQQATGAREHASAMSEIATTVSELLVTSRQITESAQQVSRIASDTAEGARSGSSAMSDATRAVQSIRSQVETIVRHMLELGRKSQQIGGVLELINELSEQTNILAINATIEAAGAGEAGRRFAALGEEIRKLADRVSGSTREIRQLIDEIRGAVNATVMATETGSKTVDAGTERFSTLHETFERILRLVATTTEASREIELSTKQQTSAVEQVNVAISNVAEVTRESEISSAQTLQTASQLASLSDDLSRIVLDPARLRDAPPRARA